MMEGDSLTGEITREEGNNAGTYEILIGSLSAGENYTITFNSADFAITKASLTITADDKSKVYGADDPVLTYTISGELFYGDTSSVVSGVELETVYGTDATVGEHVITAVNGTAANYHITHVNGTLTVLKPASNSGAGSGTPVQTPAPTPTVDASGNIITAPKLIKNTGVAATEIDENTLNTAFEKAVENSDGKKNIEIAISAVEGALAYEPTLPVSTLTSTSVDTQLDIKTGIAAVTLPGHMLTQKVEAGAKNVSLTIAQADVLDIEDEAIRNRIGDRPVIQINLKVDGKPYTWSNENAPVTVSIPYKPTVQELADPEHITVWYIDGEGNAVEVPSGRYDPTIAMVTFSTTHFSNYAVTYVRKTFDDLGDVAWAKKEIEVLASKGILTGVSEIEYAPGINITRADFLYFLVRTLGVDAKIDGNFDDISSDAYYYKEIAIAKKLGITSGTGNNKFSPDASITRQDMIVLTERTLRMLKKLGAQGTASDLDEFADKSFVAAYAVNSVATVVKEGLIVGSGGKVNPLGNTTRAEAAAFLYRIYNKY